MNGQQLPEPDDAGSPDDEPDVGDADLPSDQDEDESPPDDDSAIPVDPDFVKGAGQ